MATRKTTTKKTTTKAKPKKTTKQEDKRPNVKVETITVAKVNKVEKVEIPVSKPEVRVSGRHRVAFQPNGKNPKLGLQVKYPSADVAQMFVDNGWGKIVDA